MSIVCIHRKAKLILFQLTLILGSSLLVCCVSYYHLDISQNLNPHNNPYVSFQFLEPDAKSYDSKTLQSIYTGFTRKLEILGLKSDSLNPQLLFLIRWEEHLVGRTSSNSIKEVRSTYHITNPVYSPFENTSDRLKGNTSSPRRIRYYDKELFIRVQAIDATRNELIWSVKIYPHKKNGLPPESIPKVVRDLADSFERVQFNIDKINQP